MHRAVKIGVCLVGLLLIAAGIGLLVWSAVSAGSATTDVDRVPFYLLWLLPGGLLLLAGAGVYTFGSRTVAAISGGFVSLLLLSSGPGLILTGFIFNQSDSDRFNHSRAAHTAWYAGGGMLALGAILLLLSVVWANTEQGRLRLHRVAQVLAFGYGAMLFVQGLSAVASLPFIARLSTSTQTTGQPIHTVVLGASLAGAAMLALVPGGIFVYQGVSSYMHVPSARLRLPRVESLALFFLLCILAGGVILWQNIATGVVLPLLHVLAAITAPLALIALATRRSRRSSGSEGTQLTWRQVLLMLAWGMAVAASIAIVLEGLTLLYTIMSFLVAQHHLNNLQSAQDLASSVGNSQSDINKGVRLIFLLIVVALLGPLIEEFSKGFGVRFLRSNRPSRYQAFVFGLASGAGFAVVEAVEYGAGALGEDLHRWWDTMLLRGGSGALHALASGIVGLGWYQVFNGHRRRGAGLFLTAFGLHGVWNGLNVLTLVRIVPYFKDLSDRSLDIGLEIVLGLAALGLIATIASLSDLLVREEAPSAQIPGSSVAAGVATLILSRAPAVPRSDPTRETLRLPVLQRTDRPVSSLPANDGGAWSLEHDLAVVQPEEAGPIEELSGPQTAPNPMDLPH
ncbi:MAG: PrsW family glutamic-type intramembrane protease [Dehalococcoidia bacterium]